MSSHSQRNPLFINTILLGGTPNQKIAAAHAAGFEQIEILTHDVDGYGRSPEDLGRWLQELGVGLTDYQVLRDFDGVPDDLREKKRTEALSMLDVALRIGADTVLVTASSDPACIASKIDDDLRWLAGEAATRRLRIAYEGLAWSTVNFTLAGAWNCVQRLNIPNLGLVVDPFHLFVRGGTARDLDEIPMDRIYILQLCDSDLDHCNDLQLVIDTARHRRLLPGQGWFPIDTVLERFKVGGYAGPVGIEVFNDVMRDRDPKVTAQEAMSALKRLWLK
jgi:4-hydroxyphenylpyruvate dioxygenase